MVSIAPDVSIRLAVASDLEFIQSCAKAAYTKYIDRIGKPPAPMIADFKTSIDNEHAAVLQFKNEPVGYVIFYPAEGEMHLENIAVHPDYSGKGFGKALVGYVETAATTAAIDAVNLYTNEAMTENLAMYPALGYTEFKRCREAGFNRVYFRKQLSY